MNVRISPTSVRPGVKRTRNYVPSVTQRTSDCDVNVAIKPLIQIGTPMEPVPFQHPPLLTTDGLMTLIWKVMSDHKPYSVRDVALLLSGMGVKENTVAAKMSKLHLEENWFVVGETWTATNRKKRSYTLRSVIAMPQNETPYLRHNKTAGVSSVPVPTPEPVLTAPMEVQAVVVEKEIIPSLIEFHIKLKGVSFSFQEMAEVFTYLVASGYDKINLSPFAPSSLITTTIMIKGIPFTSEELKQVLMTLQTAGFGKITHW